MLDYVDATAYTNDQGKRAQKLFAAVVLAALDDAIADNKKYGNGVEAIARWARSRDGREVLMCAGIEPTERCVGGAGPVIDVDHVVEVPAFVMPKAGLKGFERLLVEVFPFSREASTDIECVHPERLDLDRFADTRCDHPRTGLAVHPS